MKRAIYSLTLISTFLLVGCGNAQSGETVPLSDAPAPEPVWVTDLEESKALAAESDRLILANFTGSDWCPPCVQLKRNIFSTNEFANYASENLVLLELDFPRQTPQPEELKKQNQRLAQEFDVGGFPTLVLLTPEGKEVKRSVGYMPGGPAKLAAWTEEALGR